MGDRAWAALTLYHVGGPKEVEAICAFIEEHLSSGYGDTARLTELQIWGDYEASEVSGGFTDEAETLAEKTPNSIWCLVQDGYSGAGSAAYHLPGFGVWSCSEDGGPVFGRNEVIAMLAMKPADRDRALGSPWLDVCTGMAKWLNELPSEKRPVFTRPTVDEVEEWKDDAPVDTATG